MNKKIASGIKKAIKMLEAADPVEAVSALEIVERQPLDLDTRKLVEKAKDEAIIGSPERAEILLGTIDLKSKGKPVPPTPYQLAVKEVAEGIMESVEEQDMDVDDATHLVMEAFESDVQEYMAEHKK